MESLGEQGDERGVASVDWDPRTFRVKLSGLNGDRGGYSLRSSVRRIAYAATLEALVDEPYNASRAEAYLRDCGVDTDELLYEDTTIDPDKRAGLGEFL